MSWVGFALLTALFESGKDVFGKLGLARSDEYVVAFFWRFFALPFLLPILLLIEIPSLPPTFWLALVVSGGLNVLTTILYLQAIRLSDLSLTVPLVAFTPLFLLLTSPLLLGEMPSSMGVLGILMIVAGSYLLAFRGRGRGWLDPLRALWIEPGPRRMLLVALLWSVTANVDKIGLRHSSPLFWAAALNTFIAAGLLPVAWRRLKGERGRWRANLPFLGATGLCGALTSICQMTAISLTLVPNVIAIKRTSTLLSVLWGWILFGERRIQQRLAAAGIMLAGVVLILFGGT